MNIAILSPKIQKYILELMKRHVISAESLSDKMLINYFCNQEIDEDYFSIKPSTSSHYMRTYKF